jgi:uncharacterized protein (DUF111 family)
VARKEGRVGSPWGEVRVKWIKGLDGRSVPSPEYEDLKAISLKTGLPLGEVREQVIRRAMERVDKEGQ